MFAQNGFLSPATGKALKQSKNDLLEIPNSTPKHKSPKTVTISLNSEKKKDKDQKSSYINIQD